MNILIYIPRMPKAWGGIYQYTIWLLNTLSKDTGNTYYIYHNGEEKEIVDLVKRNHSFVLLSKGAHEETLVSFSTKFLLNLLSVFFRGKPPIRTGMDTLVRKYRIDLLHSPYQNIPVTSVTCISTMHDVQEKHFSSFFSIKNRLFRYVNFRYVVRCSAKIVVSFSHVKKDIINYYKKDANDIAVCPLDLQNLWFEQLKEGTAVRPAAHTDNEPYLLYPAASWPHKNHIKLLEALHLLNSQGKKISLVCTGNNQTEHFNQIEEKIKEYGLGSQVHFRGIVSAGDLYWYYRHARAVVIPTLYEAGSFPLMESMYLGVPVICSDVTSLPETIGDPSFTFNPESSMDIAEKISRIFYDEHFREKNLANNARRVEAFRRIDPAHNFVAVYHSLKKDQVQG